MVSQNRINFSLICFLLWQKRSYDSSIRTLFNTDQLIYQGLFACFDLFMKMYSKIITSIVFDENTYDDENSHISVSINHPKESSIFHN
jgi:hypothetical protein